MAVPHSDESAHCDSTQSANGCCAYADRDRKTKSRWPRERLRQEAMYAVRIGALRTHERSCLAKSSQKQALVKGQPNGRFVACSRTSNQRREARNGASGFRFQETISDIILSSRPGRNSSLSPTEISQLQRRSICLNFKDTGILSPVLRVENDAPTQAVG